MRKRLVAVVVVLLFAALFVWVATGSQPQRCQFDGAGQMYDC